MDRTLCARRGPLSVSSTALVGASVRLFDYDEVPLKLDRVEWMHGPILCRCA
jgi:hypothetical protein